METMTIQPRSRRRKEADGRVDILKNVWAPVKEKTVPPRVAAIIVAAGNSERMGPGVNKQLTPSGGVPVLARTLAVFEQCRWIARVVVVVRAADIVTVAGLIEEFGFDKTEHIVAGGATRQKSVAAGLAAVGDADYIAVHDGARPLVTPACIGRVVEAALTSHAAAAAVRLKETVKVAGDDGLVISTPDRHNLWTVQTPQVFGAALYREAIRKAAETGADYTDDCQLIEGIGGRVQLVEGEYANLKITTREDFAFAESILRAGGEI